MTLSWVHTKAATKQQHPFLLLFGVLSDNCGPMKVERAQKHQAVISNTFFPYLWAKKSTPLCHFRDVLINRMQTSFVIFWSYRKSEFREFCQAVGILCCQVEQLKRGSKNVGQRELLGPHADAACGNPRKDLLLLGIQSNWVGLFIKSPCRQDVNMPLKSSNTIMKTDICNCICVAPLTQT